MPTSFDRNVRPSPPPAAYSHTARCVIAYRASRYSVSGREERLRAVEQYLPADQDVVRHHREQPCGNHSRSPSVQQRRDLVGDEHGGEAERPRPRSVPRDRRRRVRTGSTRSPGRAADAPGRSGRSAAAPERPRSRHPGLVTRPRRCCSPDCSGARSGEILPRRERQRSPRGSPRRRSFRQAQRVPKRDQTRRRAPSGARQHIEISHPARAPARSTS